MDNETRRYLTVEVKGDQIFFSGMNLTPSEAITLLAQALASTLTSVLQGNPEDFGIKDPIPEPSEWQEVFNS